jgi:D-alanyl-D-alanine carboxypeptidase
MTRRGQRTGGRATTGRSGVCRIDRHVLPSLPLPLGAAEPGSRSSRDDERLHDRPRPGRSGRKPGPDGNAVDLNGPPVSIATLREDVKRTGDRLAAATVTWERGQQTLSRLISEKIRTESTSDQLTADVDAARRRASLFASNLYKHPVDPLLYAIVSGKVTSIGDLTTIRRVLGATAQLRQSHVTLLNTRAQKSTALVAERESATMEALRLQARLDKDLSLLQADAVSSLTRLQAAVTAEIRRQQAAAAAALAARHRLQADASAALAAAAASWAIVATGSGAPCDGTVPADAINGFLPASALCSLRTAPGQRLIAPAAASFDRMSAAFAATFGTALCITDSYRDYATQVQVLKTKPTLAATPGRSQHGWGRAVDLCGGVQTYGTPPYLWLKANAIGFGFSHPDWAEPDGSKPEPWHWEFQRP